MLPSIDKIVMHSTKMKKSSSRKELAFISTLKYKKAPHEKGTYPNTLLKLGFGNKKSNDRSNIE